MIMDDEKLLGFYKKMLLLRRFEEEVESLYALGKIPGFAHSYIGQEAVAVGVCSALRKDDYILSNHRGHGHSIAKGVPPKYIMAELFGKADGVCKGIGGSMHSTYLEEGVLFSTAIVGGGIPIAAGVGLASKKRLENQIVVCFFGDGATNTGAFHEGINLASLWNLPVIFVCENNQYAISTHISKSIPVKNIANRASAYNIPSKSVDGMDVISVYKVVKEAVNETRKNETPFFLECNTYRFKGHGMYDTGLLYRKKEEVEKWMNRDPINNLISIMKNQEISEENIEKINKDVKLIINDAIDFAENSSYPTWELMLQAFRK